MRFGLCSGFLASTTLTASIQLLGIGPVEPDAAPGSGLEEGVHDAEAFALIAAARAVLALGDRRGRGLVGLREALRRQGRNDWRKGMLPSQRTPME